MVRQGHPENCYDCRCSARYYHGVPQHTSHAITERAHLCGIKQHNISTSDVSSDGTWAFLVDYLVTLSVAGLWNGVILFFFVIYVTVLLVARIM